jgi:A/G-specific adenine glycosylase
MCNTPAAMRPKRATTIDSDRARALRTKLLAWYATARRDLPWRRTTDAYSVWLSEIMLQQTRVETVVPYFQKFVTRFPTVHALAEAPLDDVLALWSGLGYYRRARMLHAAAGEVAARGGEFPADADGLREIAGIGAYTAGAIASIAFGKQAALVDGNVARVFARLFAIDEDVKAPRGLARVWSIAEELVPAKSPGDWNQALMELGATVCVPRDPRCLLCPVTMECDARAKGVEQKLPIVVAKKKPTLERRAAAILTRGDSILLGRRRVDGLFGGMWEPPSVVSTDRPSAPARLAAALGVRLPKLTPIEVVTHVLSHRRLEIDVFHGRLSARSRVPRIAEGAGGEYDAFEVVPLRDLGARGVTTLARKLMAAVAARAGGS